MKIIKTITFLAVLLLIPAFAFSENLGYMRISLIEGDVQVKTPEAGDWGPASINGPLMEGDQVWVPEGGRGELQLNTGTYIRLDQNSALQILSMDKDSSQFYLSQGYAYIYYDAPRGSVIQIDTPDASIRAYSRAIFRIDMNDRYTDVSVYKGYVETENRVGKARVNAGETLSLGVDTLGAISPMGPPDDWERWNKERNHRIAGRQYTSTRYLPDELRAYSSDFDDNGRWVYVQDYGYCWTPTVLVISDWAPYRHGRWIWRGGDYVWVGYEPWGWAPYHYGRWAFVRGYGWCWVPPVRGQVYWAPGYVGWVRTGDYVAWVPLAPREVYYGRGYYGPNSVNINVTQVNVTNINVYKNVYVNNGVTVVNRSTFNTAKPTLVRVQPQVVQNNIFVKQNISVKGPDVKPTRATYFGSSKQIAPAKLPPSRIRDLSVREVKSARPFVKDPNRSVINQGAPPATLPVQKSTTPREIKSGRPLTREVHPMEKGRPGMRDQGPAPRIETPPGRSIEKERPPVREQGRPAQPAPRSERPLGPAEKEKPIMREQGPAPRTETPPGRSIGKERPPVREQGPAPRSERPQVRPSERDKAPVIREETPAPRNERKVEPEKEHPRPPERGPVQRDDRSQMRPVEKERPVAREAGPVIRSGQQDNKRPAMREADRGPKDSQVKQAENRNKEVHEKEHGPKDEKKVAAPEEGGVREQRKEMPERPFR